MHCFIPAPITKMAQIDRSLFVEQNFHDFKIPRSCFSFDYPSVYNVNLHCSNSILGQCTVPSVIKYCRFKKQQLHRTLMQRWALPEDSDSYRTKKVYRTQIIELITLDVRYSKSYRSASNLSYKRLPILCILAFNSINFFTFFKLLQISSKIRRYYVIAAAGVPVVLLTSLLLLASLYCCWSS